MTRRIQEAIEARRVTGKRTAGFTLIELIVVVVIIGILSAIAIPAFLSQRQRAYNAATQSDVKNTVTALETYYAGNLAYPTKDSEITDDGATTSTNVKITVVYKKVKGGIGYTVWGQHGKSDTVFKLDSEAGSKPVSKDDKGAAYTSGDVDAAVTAATDGTFSFGSLS